MSFISKPATPQGIIPLIFVWGGTGGGKTESALRLARGMAGPTARVTIADTENKRSLLACDAIKPAGGFNWVDFQPPFTAERYTELVDYLEENCDVGVVDSLSHLWNGPDGILEAHETILDRMVGDDWQKREAASWRAWKEPKMRLAMFERRLLRCRIPLVVCLRGEIKSKLVKDERGKSSIVQSETTIPTFDLKFLFESLVAFEVYQEDGKGGLVRFPYPYAKTSHVGLQAAVPQPGKERLDFRHGAALALWCAAGGSPTPGVSATSHTSVTPAAAPSVPKPKLSAAEKTAKWVARCLEAGGGHESYALEWAVENGVLLDSEMLANWPESRLPKTKEEVDKILSEIAAKCRGTHEGVIP